MSLSSVERRYRIQMIQWDLMPWWAKDTTIGPRTINAGKRSLSSNSLVVFLIWHIGIWDSSWSLSPRKSRNRNYLFDTFSNFTGGMPEPRMLIPLWRSRPLQRPNGPPFYIVSLLPTTQSVWSIFFAYGTNIYLPSHIRFIIYTHRVSCCRRSFPDPRSQYADIEGFRIYFTI